MRITSLTGGVAWDPASHVVAVVFLPDGVSGQTLVVVDVRSNEARTRDRRHAHLSQSQVTNQKRLQKRNYLEI